MAERDRILTCCDCGEEKKAEQFYKEQSSATGRQARCILCDKELHRVDRKKHREPGLDTERFNNINRLWRATDG